jgi:hypothetical protein
VSCLSGCFGYLSIMAEKNLALFVLSSPYYKQHTLKGHTMLKSIFFGISLLIIPSLLQAKPFTVTGDSTVTDHKTGLVWQQSAGTTRYTWESAISYCESLTLGSKSDWRLPNIKELGSIVDPSGRYQAIDSTAFPSTSYSYYWSSTTSVNNTSNAWNVHFYYGYMGSYRKTSSDSVRCVRGG